MSVLDWLPWVRARRTRELNDELRTHLELAAIDRVSRGESPTDAVANARREFGNAGLAQELARDEWGQGSLWLEQLGQDVRFAVRVLRRAPGFAAIAILTVALGIGATTAIFSVVDATLLHPLPYPHPEQLVRIEDDLVGLGARDIGMSTPEWHDLQRSGVFTFVSPTWFDDNNLTGLGHAQRVGLTIVAPNYFTLLGVNPQLGATFDPADATPGFNEQAVISDGLWKRTFGADPGIVGRVVQLDSDSYRIVGVMPPGFQAPALTSEERHTEVWSAFGFAGKPLNEASVTGRTSLFPGAIARLAPGLTIDEAQRQVDVLVHTLRRQFPAAYPARVDWRVRLVPLQDYVIGDVRQPLLFLMGAVALVLLIGCTNVANLLLARSAARGREMAVRNALGGARSRLMRQLLTESVVLAAAGGVAGVVILLAAKDALLGLVPDSVPRLTAIGVSWTALCFAFAIALVAGVLFGLAPAFDIRRLDITRLLKLEGRGATASGDQKRTRHVLVIAEIAISVVLLSAAGLLVHSFWDMLHAPLGFEPRNVTVLHTRLPYPNDTLEDLYPTARAEESFVREVIRRCAALPGISDVALGSGAAVPLDHPQQDQTQLRVVFEGRASASEPPLLVTGSEVTPEYFRVLGLRLVRGRLLSDFDTDSSPPVAVVNEAMARTYWPDADALGKRLKLSPRAASWATVIGIVADARTESLASAAVPHVYASLYQREGKHLAIFLRGRVDRGTIVQHVRAEVQAVNAALPVFGLETLDETVSASLAVRRFALQLLALFAATAVLLAALGIYGVISYMVHERTHEIGVRVALGAQPADVLALVMRQGLTLAVIGAAIGLVGALIVARAMSGLLVGVSSADPVTFGLTTAVLTLVAIGGCYVPARRAIRVDPIAALRY